MSERTGVASVAVPAACVARALVAWTMWSGWGIAVAAPDAEVEIAPVPSWVAAVEPGSAASVPAAQVSDGVQYLLSDTQVNIDGRPMRQYRRVASLAVNPTGVASIANIEIGFDPAYETLAVHAIDVTRNGVRTSRLHAADIRVLQRERELERRMYDGSKTASIFLEDVRVGDIVDYAYSVSGSNPVFGGKAFGTFRFGYGSPVARIHARLLAPDGEALSIAPRHGAPEPQITRGGGTRIHRWQSDGVAALPSDESVPVWHDQVPAVQWGQFADWAAVAQWAAPLYAVPTTIGPALQAEVARIAAEHEAPAARLLAALRLAQAEVRYLAISIGAGSHAPNPPDVVFERRFGDCKDKTILMLTLLDRLGIEARAALVHTGLMRGLARRHASPGAFDHVIVRARIGERVYWLDPTRATQDADLEHLVQPDFHLALVVDPATRGLSAMGGTTSAADTRRVQTTFDARTGLDKAIGYTVVTTVSGSGAESLRSELASTTRDELSKAYLNFYASYYPGIAVAAPPTFEDDERRNRITTTERYTIPKLAEWSASDGRFSAYIATPDMASQLRAPGSTVRSAPLWLSHPNDVTVETEVLLTGEWAIDPETFRVEDDAFEFERSIRFDGDRLHIVDRYRSLADEVPAHDMVRYARHLAQARDAVGYELSWGPPGAQSPRSAANGPNWPVLSVATVVLLASLAFAMLAWRHDPLPFRVASPSAPRGLGGWLLLPLLGLFATPVIVVAPQIQHANAWSAETWDNVTRPGSDGYHPLWAPALLGELAISIGTVVFAVLLIVLMFQRRTSVPVLYIGFLIGTTVLSAALLWLHTSIPAMEIGAQDFTGQLRAFFSCAIWVSYFAMSQRVAATFVERRAKTKSTAPPPVQAASPPPPPPPPRQPQPLEDSSAPPIPPDRS